MSVLRRNLQVQCLPEGAGGPLLDCVAVACETPGRGAARAFFAPSVPLESLVQPDLVTPAQARSIGGGAVASLDYPAGQAPRIPVLGQQVDLAVTEPELALFAGLNSAFAERNGEDLQTVVDWLQWHQRTHGLQAALILDRAHPAEADQFAAQLQDRLAGTDATTADLTVVLLACEEPLGQPDLAPESHPINAPDAPGKDRMNTPPPDAWQSPLAALHLYELARCRFLGQARAVMNIDLYDLLAPPTEGQQTVFDRAVQAEQGVVALSGERIYPWALRKGQMARFGDHICSRFDGSQRHGRWVVAPARTPDKAVWRLVRIAGADATDEPHPFFRCMALRHRADGEDTGKVSRLVPKSSLVENPDLVDMLAPLAAKPLRAPEETLAAEPAKPGRVAIVTTMKNEGPFILEWLAYHRAIGVDDFLVYTNDCTDGTDTMLQMLQGKGIVQHRENPFRDTGLKPQHAALAAAESEPIIQKADWGICMDVDEFISVHTGDGTLQALFDAVPDANMISMTWRLFGNGDVAEFEDDFVIRQFTRCAPEMTRKPHQAWGFKTLFRNLGLFKKLGVHRPKGLKPQLVDQINWVNGSGVAMPEAEYRNAWRSTTQTVGYDLVTLNHYAVRSAESFLVKRDRGRVNHVDRDQGLAYWFRMNNNGDSDTSIQRMLPRLQAEYDRLLSDPDIAAAHAHSVACHRQHIDRLKTTPKYQSFYGDLTGDRMRKLARLHLHFGSSVFLAGPECIPDTLVQDQLEDGFLFTVPKAETQH